ncbi:TetR/AcrR family transcriptional regulator [Caulobacter sp.]|uniref:TetR/AcrR family transcriptional regulator n=1 Tax=Caulobacter sp. TaxID=78 RepID=UPI003BA8EFEB
MIKTTSRSGKSRLPPRDPKGGRPPRSVAAKLGAHILDAALEQFIRQGVEATSMEAIASAASVSKRTLYARFGSKMDLLVASIEYGVAKHLNPLSSRGGGGSLHERLLDVGARFLDLALKPEVIGMEALVTWIANEQPTLREVVHERGIAMAIAIVEQILEDGARQGEVVLKDKTFTAAFVLDALVTVPRDRIVVSMRLDDTKAAKRAYLQSAIDLILTGLSPRSD